MSQWPLVAIGDLLRIEHGFAFKGDYFEAEGTEVVLTPGNFKIGGGLQLRGGKEKFYSGPYPERFRLVPGDLLIAMTDLTQNAPILGSPLVIPHDGVFLHNQRLGKVEILNEDRLEKRFAYYLFASDLVRSQIRGSATGATVRHTAPGRVGAVMVRLPPIGSQRRIAEVLRAYDELIEINTRRIKILEEVAQSIYKEWFVNFRYPGHENVPLVDSALGPIPEGWEVAPLGELCSRLQAGGTPRRGEEDFWADGTVDWYRTTELQDGFLFNSAEKISERAIQSSSARMFEAGTILMAIYGSPTVGRLGVLTKPASCNQAALGLVPDHQRLPVPLLYWHLMELRQHFNSIAQGAAQQNISKAKVAETLVLVPPAATSHDFAVCVEPAWELIRTLSVAVSNLRQTRDLLLPRLVSGEITV